MARSERAVVRPHAQNVPNRGLYGRRLGGAVGDGRAGWVSIRPESRGPTVTLPLGMAGSGRVPLGCTREGMGSG